MVDTFEIERQFRLNFEFTGQCSVSNDGLINVDGDCNLPWHRQVLPVDFGTVSGTFDCSRKDLTTTKGFPKYVGKDLTCQQNKITSCEGMPKTIGGILNAASNRLETLVGISEFIGGRVDVRYNRLTSLVGLPENLNGILDLRGNPLSSLEGLPISLDRIILDWHEDLPLLRLVALKAEMMLLKQVHVRKTIEKWATQQGSLRSRIVGCQSELIKNGYAGNAKW